MESFTTYKLFRKNKQNLMEPPPYCQKFEENPPVDGPKAIKLEISDPGNILHLCESLSDSSPRGLEKKLNIYLQTHTKSRISFFISLHPSTEEAVVHVVGHTYLEQPVRFTISLDTIEECKLLADSDEVEECLPADIVSLIRTVLQVEDLDTTTTICLKVKTHKKQFANEPAVIIVCLVQCGVDFLYARKLVKETFRFCLPILINTWNCQEEQRIKIQCQSLLAVARRLFSHLGDIDDLLKEIMSEARRLTNSERCSLFLLDPAHAHLVAKVFDGMATSTNEVRIAKDQGIAGHVAETGKLLNIRDAYKHPLFYKGMDEETGCVTRNILCFPIRDEVGIIGVAQLCNKIGGHYDCYDEEAALAFSVYCGLSIMHSLIYKKVQDAQIRNQLSNELMIYHMKVSAADIAKVSLCVKSHVVPCYDTFMFSPRNIPLKEMPCFVLKMYTDLGLIAKFNIKRDMLVRFILHVQKGYRDTPYHNFTHAFSVAHFAYLLLKNLNLIGLKIFTELEALAFLTAGLCHDLDHRGTTNSFQLQSNSLLAGLYSSEGSVMERHHLSQTLCILNTKDCNFLESLDQNDYIKFLDMLRDNILATDLANHFKCLDDQMKMAEEGLDITIPYQKSLLMDLLMTCSDLSDQTKEWRITKRVAILIYDEFFSQGDMEKQMGRIPNEMMDRDKADIPELQIGFMRDVCVPVYKVLTNIFPDIIELTNNLIINIMYWETSKIVFARKAAMGVTSMDILRDPDLENEVLEEVLLKEERLRLAAEEREAEEEGTQEGFEDENYENY